MLIETIDRLSDLYWIYGLMPLVIAFGIYFTIKTKFFQFKVLRSAKSQIKGFINLPQKTRGVHPLKLYFASIGGSIGLGNIISVTGGLALGGPGILFWLWIASFIGMLVKYSEIYLGIKYRVPNDKGGFDGGSMYFVQHAFGTKFLSLVVAVLLCFYGVEVYQFSSITDVIYKTYHFPKAYIASALLGLTIYCAAGGIKRLANICTVLMPVFMMSYILMCLAILGINYDKLPTVFMSVFNSAFSGHGAIGGFIGSTLILTAKQGISRAIYSGDIGVGYDAIIQAETEVTDPAQQARLAIISLFTDTFICSMSVLIVLVSGLWQSSIDATLHVMHTLAAYFPYMDHFMVILLFLAGFTTVISFLTVAYKAASFISPKYGKLGLSLYAIPAFIIFSIFDPSAPGTLMFAAAGIMVTINLCAIFKLRNEIKFQ